MNRDACRLCGLPLREIFVDLGMSPPSNRFLKRESLEDMEPFLPLQAWTCTGCMLVQVKALAAPEGVFSDYAYFSSFSDTWLTHARHYRDMAIERFGLGASSQVIEVASNDGYLLRYFKERGIRVLGIEPAQNVAEVARGAGIATEARFFGVSLARELAARGLSADLLVGNNVLAHVPDLDDFVAGLAVVLKKSGVLTLEFPSLARLIEGNQFDTIYHEHYSYFSLLTAERALNKHGLELFDADELPTHGGSLRLYAQHAGGERKAEPRVAALRASEDRRGVARLEFYQSFRPKVEGVKRDLLSFLIEAKRNGKRVAAYGAPAKGNTLLNYCGIRTDFIDFAVDRSPYKQGLFLPGTHIPIHAPDRLKEERPDFVLILPWNIRDEIVESMKFIRDWGGRFVIPIPRVEIVQ